MLRLQLLPALLALALAGCHDEPAAPAPAATVPPASTAPMPAASTAPVRAPATPATNTADEPAVNGTPDGDRNLARLDGYGPLRFGMTVAEIREAWGTTLHGAPPDGAAEACHYLDVVGDDATPFLAFMVDGGRFVRYDVSGDALLAPGGGRRGMTEAELQALYRGSLQATPHEYVDGGKYLAFDTSGVAPSRLVFETDAQGRATEWRVGLSPQVDYVEGCS
jgi:hypothetical protein